MQQEWKSKVIKLVGLVLGLGMVVSLSKGLWQLYEASGRLEEAEDEYLEVESMNVELQEKLVMVQSEDFIEEQARNKLNMKLPGETVLVVLGVDDLEARVVKDVGEGEEANWRKWWELFK